MRKKSENRSNIMRPLHLGHSIESSQVVMCTAGGVAKAITAPFFAVRNFNSLGATYLLPRGHREVIASTKTFRVSFFVQGG